MYVTLLRRAERYSFPKTLGMGLRIPITNCSYSGLCRLPVWTAFSVTLAIRPAYRQSSSLGSRSMRSPTNMRRNSDNHAAQYTKQRGRLSKARFGSFLIFYGTDVQGLWSVNGLTGNWSATPFSSTLTPHLLVRYL